MQYQRQLLAQKNDVKIYCYCLSWARDSEAYFISTNNDVCDGFNSTKDYCYGRGYQTIYYKFYGDTLRIFSNGTVPSIPKQTAFYISVTIIRGDMVAQYEEKFKNKEIEKVTFDSLKNIPCTVANPPIDLNNLKFK